MSQHDDTETGSSPAASPGAWTSHGNDAPTHQPVRTGNGAIPANDGMAESEGHDGGPVVAPDGEVIEMDGGSSDGGESGQDAGSDA